MKNEQSRTPLMAVSHRRTDPQRLVMSMFLSKTYMYIVHNPLPIKPGHENNMFNP